MPGPKKKPDLTKRYEETKGKHIVSPDGAYMKIGGSTFKRTVLPSVATKHVESEKFASELDELDSQPFKETSAEAD
jgi:hypothetical protein